MKRSVVLFAAGLSVLLCSAVHAALEARLGGLAVYDTDRNITWLANANAAAGSIYDDFMSGDGRMSWDNAVAWVNSLSVGGYSDWRLPRTLLNDPSCPNPSSGIGQCSGNELGHLFFTELSGANGDPSQQGDGVLASGDPDLALFANIQSRFGSGGIYWSEEYDINPAMAWEVSMSSGIQDFARKDVFGGHFVWAVRDGDTPSAVPLPGAIWLFGSAMLVLAGLRIQECRQFSHPSGYRDATDGTAEIDRPQGQYKKIGLHPSHPSRFQIL